MRLLIKYRDAPDLEAVVNDVEDVAWKRLENGQFLFEAFNDHGVVIHQTPLDVIRDVSYDYD